MKSVSFSHEFFLGQLKKLMESTGVNQEDLARHAGISPQAVSGYMKGSFPKANILAEWSKNLDLNIQWLLSGEGPMLLGKTTTAQNIEELREQVAALKDELLEVNRQYRAAAEKLLRLSGSPEPSCPARADGGEGEGSVPGEASGRFYGRENQDKNGG